MLILSEVQSSTLQSGSLPGEKLAAGQGEGLLPATPEWLSLLILDKINKLMPVSQTGNGLLGALQEKPREM